MIAAFTMVGRMVGNPSVEKINGKNKCSITLETERPFRTEAGYLERDLFVIEVWRGIAMEVEAACHDGSLVVVRGRLETARRNGNNSVRLVAERICPIREGD